MSGKKAWQVANVLNQTDEVLNKLLSSYETYIQSDLEKIKLNEGKVDSLSNEIGDFVFPDIGNIERELPKEAAMLKTTFNNLKTASCIRLSNNYNKFINELSEINKEIRSEQKKAANLREEIRRSSDYMDAEYNEAKVINSRIQSLRMQYTSLVSKVSNENTLICQTAENLESKFRDLTNLKNEIRHFRKQAEEIKKIRTQANALKKMLDDIFKSIDKDKALKFYNGNYNKLLHEKQQFNKLADESIIDGYSNLSAKLSNFKNEVESAYNQWLADKQYSENFLESLKQIKDRNDCILIEDLAEGSDRKTDKLTYFDTYYKTSHRKNFLELIKQAENELKQENFKNCNKILKEATELYENISVKADELRLKIEAELNITLKMRSIMEDLGFYQTELNFIDGDVLNGFYLNCRNGDTINFEEIRFNEKGELTVNLDHQESTDGTCSVRWKDMKERFNNEGIPLTDVTKHGRSVIYHREYSAKGGTSNKKQTK